MSNDEQISKVEKIIDSYPRVIFCLLPTPLQHLKRLSKQLGVNFFIKRDDLTGPAVFGGNKGRKLEYLIADALNKEAKYVFTYGATQSNHAMQVATLCRMQGLKPILYLTTIVEPKKGEYCSNLLLDKILGAEIHLMPADIGFEGSYEKALKQFNKLESEGHKCYNIPGGGSNAIGSLGYVRGFTELMKQVKSKNIGEIDYIIQATGSGGTLAGILAGKALFESDIDILSFAVGAVAENYPAKVVELANESLNLLGIENLVKLEHTNIDSEYYGEAYETPTKQSTKAIKLLARKEGIFIDPVYTAKAMAGLLDYVEKGKISQGSNIVFWHTGGATALFAEKEIRGDFE